MGLVVIWHGQAQPELQNNHQKVGCRFNKMKTRIHVNQHNVRYNKKNPEAYPKPPITAKDYKQNRKGFEAHIIGEDGSIQARIVSRPKSPLSCGATVWIETELEVDVH